MGSRNTQEIIHRKFPDITSKFSYTVNLTWNLFESKELYSVIVEGNNDNRLRFISSVFRTRVNQNQQNGMEEEIEVGAWRK